VDTTRTDDDGGNRGHSNGGHDKFGNGWHDNGHINGNGQYDGG
jgi:hypothetical protein